jgi:hypothetical protein
MARRKKPTKTQRLLEEAGHEVKVNPPKILAHTAAKFGEEDAEKQRKAIVLDKARRAGARIPRSIHHVSDKELDRRISRATRHRR